MSPIRPRIFAAALAFTASAAVAHTNERGLDPQNFDEATGACADFFQHANGGWLKSNPIPAEYSQWSLDDELRERNLALLRGDPRERREKARRPGSNLRQDRRFLRIGDGRSGHRRGGLRADPAEARARRRAARRRPTSRR